MNSHKVTLQSVSDRRPKTNSIKVILDNKKVYVDLKNRLRLASKRFRLKKHFKIHHTVLLLPQFQIRKRKRRKSCATPFLKKKIRRCTSNEIYLILSIYSLYALIHVTCFPSPFCANVSFYFTSFQFSAWKMERFARTVNDQNPLSIFGKRSNLNAECCKGLK